MTSHDTGWVCLLDGRAVASVCRRGLARSVWWLPASSGCTARGWGAIGRGWGALWVGGAFVQYAQPLASGARPLVEQADSGRDSKWGRCRTLTTGPQLRWRAGNGGGRPVTETPGCAARTPDSLLRGPVSTVLTSTSPAPVRPVGIVGILRFFLGAQRRCGVDVSTMDTSDLLGPASACQTSSLRASSPPGPPACPRLPPERVPQTS